MIRKIGYDIASKGTLDIGKLYKVFGVSGYDASGFIKADMALKGNKAMLWRDIIC